MEIIALELTALKRGYTGDLSTAAPMEIIALELTALKLGNDRPLQSSARWRS